jgi:transcriptional regulator with XRE-family HTH domain
MEINQPASLPILPPDLDQQLAQQLRLLRQDRGWSLDTLATQTGISRATLSRIENAEVSATAVVLGRLCAAYGLLLSRLLMRVESTFEPLLRRAAQPVWHDAESGQFRRMVSPPSEELAGEVIECELPPNAHIAYDKPPRPLLEHHLVMLAGQLTLTLEDCAHRLNPGDCLRFRLNGSDQFTAGPDGARYYLFLV